jgi:hypothetical protein
MQRREDKSKKDEFDFLDPLLLEDEGTAFHCNRRNTNIALHLKSPIPNNGCTQFIHYEISLTLSLCHWAVLG